MNRLTTEEKELLRDILKRRIVYVDSWIRTTQTSEAREILRDELRLIGGIASKLELDVK